jgi:hypothetical protein
MCYYVTGFRIRWRGSEIGGESGANEPGDFTAKEGAVAIKVCGDCRPSSEVPSQQQLDDFGRSPAKPHEVPRRFPSIDQYK